MATITVRVVDGLGNPVVNCFLACSASSGYLSPTSTITDGNGEASLNLYFVESMTQPSYAEVSVLRNAVQKVQRATVVNSNSIQHTSVLFEPNELTMISRYSPAKHYQNLVFDLPAAVIPRPPVPIVAHVTVHAKDAEMGVVRAVGSIQVMGGEWVRDWTLTKIYEISQAANVAVRVGDLMRGAVNLGGNPFDANYVQDHLISLYDEMHGDTMSMVKARLLTTTQVSDDALAQTGIIAQTIAQEVSASVGSKVHTSLQTHIQNLQQDVAVSDASKTAIRGSQIKVLQTSSATAAAMAQRSRQMLNSIRGA